MLRLKWLLCGATFGLLASAVSCGGTAADVCDATTCADGCCDAYGQCITPTSAFRCGQHGEVCTACAPTQTCEIGVCVEGVTGGGDGSTGGGDGSVGGGSATTGGGTATTGGGTSATTGGGSATTGGGTGTPTCLANAYQPTPSRTNASSTMAPGYACISCHSGANFNGQNPNGLTASRDIYQFMGTVFRSANEKDLCKPTLGTSATVEIYNAATNVKVLTMTVNSGGNFYGNVSGGRPASYTAKLITSTGTREMTTAQTVGDCNTCHTVAGENDAPGRIYLP